MVKIVSFLENEGKVFSSVQFSHSVVSDSLRPHELQHTRPPCPSPTPKFIQTPVHQFSDAIQLPHPLSPPSPPAFNLSVFSNESALPIRWPKCWSFIFNISPSNKHPGLISFRMDWLDLLAIKGLESLLQHHSSKASILWHSAFFTVQLSHPDMTTGKTIAYVYINCIFFIHCPLMAIKFNKYLPNNF